MTGRPIPTEHGTTGYQQYWGCKCPPCTKAMSRYRKGLTLDHSRGKSRRVDVGPVREHVKQLVAAGATGSSIADACDGAITRVQISRILDGTTRSYVLRPAAEAIMAIPVGGAIAGHQMISAIGLRRRVNALHAIGYTKDDIGAAMGCSGSLIVDLVTHERVMRNTHNRVAAAYDALAGTPGASELQRWRAIRSDWAPPMAWDDEDIDDPKATPNWKWVRCAGAQCNNSVHKAGVCQFHYARLRRLGVFDRVPKAFRQAVERHCGARGNDTAGLVEDLAYLKAQGLTMRRAAQQIGRGVTYVEKIWSQA